MSSKQINSPETIGWLLVIMIIVMLVIFTVDYIRERIRNRHIRAAIAQNDRNIIQAAQEARRDFR